MDAVWPMFAKIAVSAAVGFVGAYPLATASGLMGANRDLGQPFVTAAGFILFFLIFSLIGPGIGLIRKILESLNGVEVRPNSGVSLTMLILGTICAISAIVIQLNAGSQPQSLAMNLNAPGNGFGITSQVPQPPSGSFALGLLTTLTFLLGTGLIALGVWACLVPAPAIPRTISKPVVREFDEAAV